jgi:hypothetical protein
VEEGEGGGEGEIGGEYTVSSIFGAEGVGKVGGRVRGTAPFL